MSSKTIRWLHLSDFHVGKDGYEQGRLFAEIVKEITRWKTDLSFVPDYVFITGDVANKGLKKEYETFRREFLTPLQEALPRSTAVIPIPGNHDVERPSSDALGRDALLDGNNKFFDANKEGKTTRDQVIPRFKQYKRLMSADVSPDWLACNDGAAIYKQDLAGIRVGVVGLNTAWLSKAESDKGRLTPGYRLVESALKQVVDCEIKIVLGHHPLSWWHEREEAHIRTLFARSNVIYLHGHMHRSEGRIEEGGSDNFLVLQAGAAFQARDGDEWVNGFSWGEVDLEKAEVRVSPRYWDSVNHEWPPQMGSISLTRRLGETDWWRFQLPGRKPTVSTIESVDGPAGIPGWQVLTKEALDSFAREITAADAESFFDGAEPDWGLALSSYIPVRLQAQALLASVASFKGVERPQFALVRGPTAEGKSLALRQTVAAAVRANPELRVLWHLDETAGLDTKAFESRLTPGTRWLIASDHGDLVIKGLAELMQNFKRAGRSDVQFVVAAHDSDWRVAKGDLTSWSSFAHYQEARLSGLPPEDATSIAKAWITLTGASQERREGASTSDDIAHQLLDAAKSDGATHEGALFGALLTLRHGPDLRDHVRNMQQRLNGIAIPGSGSVGLAFLYIAAMHTEGLSFLSRKVLAEALGCDQRTLQQNVLAPLASESAGSGGSQLRTRHRRIAQAAIELYADEGGDVDQLYQDLAASAVRLGRIKGEWLDELSEWEYSLADHFFKRSRPELAIKIAAKLLDVVLDNSHYAVNLARLKRESKDVPGAIAVLSTFPPPSDNRGFWTEWGTACGLNHDYVSNAWLHAYSLSDDLSSVIPSADQVMKTMAGLAKAFAELHTQYGQHEFHQARAAAAAMGLVVSNDNSILKEHQLASSSTGKPNDATEAIAWLLRGFAVALEAGGTHQELFDRIGDPSHYKFQGLFSRIGPQFQVIDGTR